MSDNPEAVAIGTVAATGLDHSGPIGIQSEGFLTTALLLFLAPLIGDLDVPLKLIDVE